MRSVGEGPLILAALLPVELAAAIETLVEKLAARRFEEVENSGESGLLTAEELRREFSYYPRWGPAGSNSLGAMTCGTATSSRSKSICGQPKTAEAT